MTDCVITLDKEAEIFYTRILPEFSKLYFFGYPLSAINECQVFRRLCSVAPRHLGFCLENSAINMIALKDITSARLVRGKNDACGWHSWVEIEEDGIALAVDACWLYSNLDQPNIYVMETERYY